MSKDKSGLESKLIYIIVHDKHEQLELANSLEHEHVKELFRTAGGACKSDIIKLYNHHGNLVNISTNLPANSPSTRYRLEIVNNHYHNSYEHKSDINSHQGKINFKTIAAISCPHCCCCNGNLLELGNQDVEPNYYTNNLHNHRGNFNTPLHVSTHSSKHKSNVLAKFDLIKDQPVDDATQYSLRQIDFNNWHYKEADLLRFMKHMLQDFSITTLYNIQLDTLHRWLSKIFLSYNDAPFHNFKHSFCVTQMTYSMLNALDLAEKLPKLDIFILLFSAICHDLDHSGFNNTFQINAQTELALRYNDSSPLENHHSATAFQILADDEYNIVKNMQPSDYRTFRKGVIHCILATDLARHDTILKDFINICHSFNYSNDEHRLQLLMILIKVADISNEVRPVDCASAWMECLFLEYFKQSDVEKERGLKVTPYMDRESVIKSKSQIEFINFLLLPLVETLSSLCPKVQDIIKAVHKNLNNYKQKEK